MLGDGCRSIGRAEAGTGPWRMWRGYPEAREHPMQRPQGHAEQLGGACAVALGLVEGTEDPSAGSGGLGDSQGGQLGRCGHAPIGARRVPTWASWPHGAPCAHYDMDVMPFARLRGFCYDILVMGMQAMRGHPGPRAPMPGAVGRLPPSAAQHALGYPGAAAAL